MSRDRRPAIVVNGKFLGAELNGVHRTAAHYTRQLTLRAAQDAHVRLLAPKPATADPDLPDLRPEVHPGRFGSGQGWEMLTLPRLARGALLVNLCNLAPLAHRNSVVMIHDVQSVLYPEDYTFRQVQGYRLLTPLTARRARRVLTVSAFSKASLIDHGVGTEDTIDVVHNGTDHIISRPADPSILARHGLDRGGYVMILGSAKSYKNLRRVFDALREPLASGRRLVVAGGPGADAYRAKGWAPPAGTLFTGFVPDSGLRALYEGARMFLFPSLTEGFGLPPVEAMHCATPVVAARAGAMPEVCGGAAALADPEDTAAWRRAIERLDSDPDAVRDLTERGRRRAAELSWKAAGDRLWSLIRPLLPSG